MSNDDGDTVLNAGPEPTEGAAAGFKIRISLNGVFQGWVKVVENWIAVTPNESEATIWTLYSYNGRLYIRKSANIYWSINRNTLVILRDWAGAAGWQRDGDFLRCLTNGNLVGIEGDMLYANGRNVVRVEFVPV